MDLNDDNNAGGGDDNGAGGGDGGGQNGAGAGDASGFFGGAAAGGGDNNGASGGDGGGQGSGQNDGAGGGDPGDNNGAGGGDGGASAEFLNLFSAERDGDKPSLQDWVQARGYKSIEEIAKSARDTQAALRDSGRIKVPGEDASEEDRAAFHKAIGVPEKPEDYALPELKDEKGEPLRGEDGEPIPVNEERLRAIQAIAHKHGVPKAALDGVLQDLAMADLQEMQGAQADMDNKMGELLGKLGDKKAETMASMTAAARDLGLTTAEQKAIRAALGPERTLEVMSRHGARLGEDAFVNAAAGNKGFGMSAAEAQKTLDERRGNRQWLERADVNGTPENAEYNRLLAQIERAADREAALAAQS